jgi:DNA helicase-2/ATP-dependent DNA helicase PcrA
VPRYPVAVAIELNPSQKKVVEHDVGPMLVLAGAGSGKTRVVTERIARLLERGVSPQNILAMTFTNKAAAEMHERVVRLVGAKAGKDLRICTFHRFGLDTLGAEVRALGLRGTSFAIFDQADATSAIREILREIRAGKNFDIGDGNFDIFPKNVALGRKNFDTGCGNFDIP